MSDKAVKDLLKSEKELREIIGSAAFFLYKNGIKWESVQNILRDTMEDELKVVKKICDKEDLE